MGYVILSVVMLCVVVLSVLAAKLGGHLMRRVQKLIGEKRKKFWNQLLLWSICCRVRREWCSLMWHQKHQNWTLLYLKSVCRRKAINKSAIIELELSRISQVNYWRSIYEIRKHCCYLESIFSQKLFTKDIKMTNSKAQVWQIENLLIKGGRAGRS
jgi:hypothetical protein